MVTIRVAHTCEALLKVTILQAIPDYMGYYRAEEAILPQKRSS